jgi:hypothetical protein
MSVSICRYELQDYQKQVQILVGLLMQNTFMNNVVQMWCYFRIEHNAVIYDIFLPQFLTRTLFRCVPFLNGGDCHHVLHILHDLRVAFEAGDRKEIDVTLCEIAKRRKCHTVRDRWRISAQKFATICFNLLLQVGQERRQRVSPEIFTKFFGLGLSLVGFAEILWMAIIFRS